MFSVRNPPSLKAVILLILVFAGLASATNFTYIYNSSNPAFYSLESGTIVNSGYNSTLSAYALNGTNTTGSYLSPVLDAGANSTWVNISFAQKYCYGQNLPNLGGTYAGCITPPNMTGNVFLLHFDNQNSMGENSTFVADYSGSYTNLSCPSTTACPVINSTQTKQLGTAASFNGTQYYAVGDVLESTFNGQSGATIMMWVRPESAAANAALLAKYDSVQGNRQFLWRYMSTQKFDLVFYSVNSGATFRQVTSTPTYPINNWYHLVLVFNISGDSYTMYVNGAAAASTKTGAAITSMVNSAEVFMVGAIQDGAANQFRGVLDEVSIWNRTLSAAEVSNIYKMQANRYNVSIKACTVSDCSDQSTFQYTYNSTPQTLTLNATRYFQYNISVASDSAGNTTEIANVTLYSNTIPASTPTVSINLPVNNVSQSSTGLTLNFSAITTGSIHTCWYSINNTANVTIPGCTNATTNQTVITVGSGLNQNITVYANDSLGYIDSSTRLFNVDADTPIISVTSPVNNTYSPSNQMLVNVTTSDLTLQSCWYSINGGANVSYTCNATAFNVTLTNGVSAIYFFANDSFGQNASTGLYNYNYSNLLSLTGVLNTTTVPTSAWVNITGVLKLANGSTISGNNVSIFVDGAPATLMTTGWWNNSWNYRKLINITENYGANLTDFQYNFSFDTRVLISQGYMQSNCADIRFTDSNANPLSYFIESGCNTTTTNIWVKSNLTASTTNTIYVYYGNPSATAGSDPDGTFILYEDFNGSSINLTKWTVYSGLTYTVSNSIYQVTDITDGWLAANGLNTSTSNYQGVYFEFRNLNWSHAASDLFQWELALYNSSGGYYTMGIGIQDSHTGTSEGYLYSHIGNSATAGAINYDNSMVSLIGTRAENGAVTYYVNGTSKRTGNTNATFDKIIVVSSKNAAGPYPTTDAGLVWVRTFSSSMPSLSFNGSQESNASTTTLLQTNANGSYSVILVAPATTGVKNVSITSSFANAMGNSSTNLTVINSLSVSISAPDNNTNQTNTTLTLNFSAASPFTLSTCAYSVNGTANTTIAGCASGESNQTNIVVSNGLNQNITVWVNDSSGTVSSAMRTFNIDSIAPALTLFAPENNSALTSTTVNVNVSVSDAVSGLDSCWYSVNKTANITFTCASNATFVTTTGSGNVTVYVNDTFGNYNSTTSYFTISTASAPTHGTPTLNSTDNSNTTSQNLTVYNVSTSDANADPVKNIINWYLNDTSITTLNWAFDGGSNSTFTKDYSNNNYSGNVSGAQYISSAGRDGFGAYNFTNSSTYVATPSLGVSSLLKDNFTITFWANPGAVADKPNFGFSGSGGFNSENPFASYDSALTVGNGAGAQTFTALPDAGANTWTHYAIVDNGTHYSVYVNGTLSASTAITVNPSYGSNRTFILGNSGFDSPYDDPYVGLMDDFVIYSKALSPAQINAIYNNRSDLIVSAELANSQSWRACITPNDGSADGVEKCSNSLVTLSAPDVTAPVVSISLPANNTNQSNVTLNLTFTATDAQSSLSTCWYSVNGTANVTISGCISASPNTTALTVSAGNNQNVTVYANDTSGNLGSAISYFNINAAPTHATPILNATTNTNLTTQNITVYNVSTSDANADSVKNIVNWYVNGTSFENVIMPFDGDSNNATFAKDYSGYASNGTVNGGAAWSGTSGFDGKGAYTFDGVDDYISIPNNSATDIRGNLTISLWTKSNVATSQYDTILMKTSSTSWNDGYGIFYNSNNEVRFFVSNFANNVAVATLTPTNWNYIVGTYDGSTVRIYVNGVEGTSDSYSGAISGTGAALELSRGASNLYNINGVIDELRIYDEALSASEVLALYQNQSSTITSTHLTVGSSWQACITPNDGNTDGITKCSNNLTILSSAPADVTAPVITINSPTNNTNQSSTTLTLNFSATDASSFTCWYSINGTANVTIPGCVNATTNQTTITVTNGLNQNITLYVNDSLGNLGSTIRTFNINSNAPVITVNSPANNTNQSSTTLTINFSAATSAILDTCYYSINGTSNVTVNGCINVTTNQTSISLTAGLNQNVTIYANDTLGNLGSATRTFSIDSVAPVITFNTPTNNSNLSSSTLTINFSAVDQLPLSSCWYSINGTSNVTIAGCVNATTNQTTATIATGSAQNITVYVNDSVGNLASATRTFNYNTNAPTVTINAPTNYQNQSSTSLVLNFSATTANTLDSCWYTINNTVNNSIACVNATTAQTTVTVVEGLNQNVTVYANDTLGNTATAIAYFTVDQTAPSISVNAPEYNANLTSTPMTINFSATDALTLSTCWYSINGTANVTVPGCLNAVTNQTTATITTGLNQNITIYANDSLGNIANIVIPFNYVQSSSINLTINTPADNQNQANTTLDVNFTLASASSISSCWYNLNNTSNVTINPCVNNADNLLSITASNGLNQNITVYANDSTGNLTSATKAFHIDSIAPTVTINLPANNTNYASTNLTVNFTATDTTSINSCWYSINSITNVTVPGCASGVSNQFQINASLATGQNITLYANDSFGNIASTTHYFGIDLSATVLTINLPINNTNQSSDTLILNFSAQNNYGISNCWYSINATTNVTVAGCVNATTNQTTITVSNSTSQTITIYANDTFGNETSTTRTFNIDPTTPNITINTPSDYANISTSTLVLNFTPTDNFAIHTCWYSVNNTANTTISCTNGASSQTSVTIAAGLNQNVTVYVNDSAGNQNHSTTHFNYTESNLTVTINAPVNNTNQTTNEITLNFTPTSTLDISTCMYSINNTANVTVPGCANGQSNETNLTLAEGANQNITVHVNDSNGNWASATRYFTIDSTAPSLNIYSPVNASTTTDSTISITYSATDTGIGVQNCYYSLDTAPNVTISNCQNTTITPGLGTHNLTVYVNDSLGNLNQSQLITFTLTQAPAPSSGGGGGSGGGGSGGSSTGTSNNTTPNAPTMGSSSANTITVPDAHHAILVNEEYIVNTTFNPDSTVLSIEFKPKEDSTGTLVLLLPLSFEDYQNGRILINPLPTRVESSPNGIKAYYENITVFTDIGFKAQVTVKSALSKGVINEFKITFINANISREFNLEDNPIAQNYVPITIVILAIVLGAIYWFMLKKKNKKEEGKTISS